MDIQKAIKAYQLVSKVEKLADEKEQIIDTMERIGVEQYLIDFVEQIFDKNIDETNEEIFNL